MSGFTKLVPEIIQSSIWNEPPEIRCVWITLLAIKDEDGYVRGDSRVISRMANIDLETTEKALTILQNPDPNSHTPDNEGRRVEKAGGGWIVLNHDRYRLRDMKAEHAEYMKKWREKRDVKKCDSQMNHPSVSVSVSASEEKRDCKGETSIADSIDNQSPLMKTRKLFQKPTIDEIKQHIAEKGYKVDAEKFWHYYESNGWRVGKNPMKSWQSATITWHKSSQKPAPVRNMI